VEKLYITKPVFPRELLRKRGSTGRNIAGRKPVF
jgi:hypothetical protein